MHNRLLRLIGLLSFVVSGCEVSIMMPSSSALQTSVPGMFETIVAATAAAAQTQTAALISPTLTPSWTPLPSHTPSLTPTLTATFHFSLGPASTPVRFPTAGSAAATASPSDSLGGCALISQTPKDGSHFDSRRNFSVDWKVKNTGSAAWDVGSVDFAYYSGTKLHKKQLYDLPDDIPVGESVTLSVSMAAPKADGTYNTVWSLRRGDNHFCHVDLTIRVP